MEFDLQRFEDEQAASAEPQTLEEPIPEELGGLDEDIAREAIAEWKESSQESAETETPETPPVSDTVSRSDYQAKVDEAERLKAQLAAYQQKQQISPQQIQPPPIKLTPEISAKINQAITAEAMNMVGFSADDVASLEYADNDDPRLSQWAQARSLAQSNVYGAIRQAQLIQQQQAQQFIATQQATMSTYNALVQKEFKEPDFKAIQNFAINEFFEQLSPIEKKAVANSYLHIERQIASPAEMFVVKNYYEKAKAAYRNSRGKKTARTPQQQAANLPRVDQISGAAGKGEVTVAELEHMLETTDFDKIPEVYQKKLLGLS